MDAKKLTAAQLDHLLSVRKRIDALIEDKYTAGAAEHGGLLLNVGPSQLLTSALEEVVDLAVYLTTLESIDGWIGVGGRLPDPGLRVLAYDGGIVIAHIGDVGDPEGWLDSASYLSIPVTHWRPLPELPKSIWRQ